jgi:hypothetical protein
MNKRAKELTKQIPNYGKITASRYKGVKGKAWKILSDYTRMRDFILYGFCVSCGSRIKDWRATDAGHYISMGGHGALTGFSDENIHAQCKKCNLYASQHTGDFYTKEITRRGIDVPELTQRIQKTVKADDFFFIEKILEIREKFINLKQEYPEYDYPEYV